MNKDGTIVHSNHSAEIGFLIDQKSEPCLHCHQGSKPLERVPNDMRWRTYTTPGGQRMLGAMAAIRNFFTVTCISSWTKASGFTFP